MQPIIYDVAVSADGFIAGPNNDVSAFLTEGKIVEDYFQRLSTYQCVIMGKRTYEFAYQHGLKPGENPYPHMQTLVFSKSIEIPSDADVEIVRSDAEQYLHRLRQDQKGPIYLCGGGIFAGKLLKLGLIDVLRLKRAPFFLGQGTSIFAGQAIENGLKNITTEIHDDGFIYQEFQLVAKHGLRIPNAE